MGAAAVAAPAFGVHEISKRFGDAEVLRGVSLSFRSGWVHGLLGANGSGKSTLMKIISGAELPTSGTLEWDGKHSRGLRSPAEAASVGIRIVHQESPLIDSLTVLEAVAVFRGYGTTGIRPVRWRALRRRTARLLEEMDVPVRLADMCAKIRPAERAGLALAIAVGDQFVPDETRSHVRLLLLDEVTAPIPAHEADRHLERIRTIADRGISVVMVTHRLAELRIAESVIVLRAGEVVYNQDDGPRLSDLELIDEVMGAPHGHAFGGGGVDAERRPVRDLWTSMHIIEERRRAKPASTEAVVIDGLVADDLRGLSVTAKPGEIVGFMGLPQSGLGELPQVLSGGKDWSSGSITVSGKPIGRPASPRDFIEAGLMAVPGDRLREGGVAVLSTGENVMLPALRDYWHNGSRASEALRAVIRAFDVRPADPRAVFGRLSGGNQQKVLLGKWLALGPSVLVLDDPTHGIDPVARETVFDAIADAAALGVCVLFFSTEPAQLVRMCGRVLVIRAGVIDAELSGAELTEATVTKWSYA